jgi:hypothetical protein
MIGYHRKPHLPNQSPNPNLQENQHQSHPESQRLNHQESLHQNLNRSLNLNQNRSPNPSQNLNQSLLENLPRHLNVRKLSLKVNFIKLLAKGPTAAELAAQKRRAYSEEAWRRYQEYQKVSEF